MSPMDLLPYLKTLTEQEQQELAARCETTANYLWKLARGFKYGMRPKPRLASLIERETNQTVRRWESNPEDWFDTWPELIGVAGAPPVPACIPRSCARLQEARHG